MIKRADWHICVQRNEMVCALLQKQLAQIASLTQHADADAVVLPFQRPNQEDQVTVQSLAKVVGAHK